MQHTVTAAYHPQSDGKAKRVIHTIKSCIRKLQVTSKQGWSRVLQIAASAYRMVPHEATGISPFLILYGREAIMPEEIDHNVYASNSNYEKAVAGHIEIFLNLQDMASKCNEEKIKKSREYFDRKYVKKLGCICLQLAM